MLGRIRSRVEMLFSSFEVRKQAIVAPSLVFDVACSFIIIESVATYPAASVDDGATRETLDGRNCTEGAIQMLLRDSHKLVI